jgi:biopolymer transport protein ExbD
MAETRRMPSTKLSELACVVVSCIAIACGRGEPSPVSVVRLSISADGSYLVGGKPVARQELEASLRALPGAPGGFELEVAANRQAHMDAVAAAISSANAAGIARIRVVQE